MPLKVVPPRRDIPVRRILSIVTLAIMIGVLVLMLRQPKPVAPQRTRETLAASAQSFQTKMSQLVIPPADGKSADPIHLNSDEIAAAISEAAGTLPASGGQASGSTNVAAVEGVATPREPIISFEGDQIKGQFVSELAGKEIYVTVSGRLGSKDGYATFEPTEFKVGDLNVPVSLVNDALQRKMAEEREKMKLPHFVGDLRIENGELVVTPK